MSLVGTIKMNSHQYLMLGEDPPGCRLELINGEVSVSPSPNLDHSFTVGELYAVIRQHVRTHKLGIVLMDVDTAFGQFDVRRPDILYVAAARQHLIGDSVVEVAPDLCIEVLSPSNAADDRGPKTRLYAKAGVKNLWLVDPAARTFQTGKLKAGRYVWAATHSENETINAAPFDDLKIKLSDLWRQKSSSGKSRK